MRNINKLIAIVIVICLMFTQAAPITVVAKEKNEKKSITIESDGNTDVYTVIKTSDDLYLSAEDFSKITRYKYIDRDDFLSFSLGHKVIRFNKSEKNFLVKLGSYMQTYDYSGAITEDNVIYLPMSELLPWLNTNVSAKNDTLVINSDPFSFWEFSTINGDAIDVNEGVDFDSGWTVAGLATLNVFDTLVNVRWQKFVPMKAADSKYKSYDSLYDVQNYQNAFMDMACDDTLYSDSVNGVLKKTKNAGKLMKSAEEILGVGDAKRDDISKFLISLREDSYYKDIKTGNDIDVYDLWSEFDDKWQKFETISEVAGGISEGLKAAKRIEVSLNASPDYYRAVSYLEKNVDDDNHILKNSAGDTRVNLENIGGALIGGAFTIGTDMLGNLVEDGLEDAIGADFIPALKVVKAALSFVWPSLLKATEGLPTVPVYSDIMYTTETLSYKLDNEPTISNLHNSRALKIVTYKSAKKCFEVEDKLLSAFGGKNLKDYKISLAEDEIIKLALSAECVENDSIESKDEKRDEIGKILSNVKLKSLTNLFSFAAINEIGNTYRIINEKYNLHETMGTDTWRVMSSKSEDLSFTFNATVPDGVEPWMAELLPSDKCIRMSGKAKDLLGIVTPITVKEFEENNGVHFGWGNGIDLETSMYEGMVDLIKIPNENTEYHILLKDINHQDKISPETDVYIQLFDSSVDDFNVLCD